MKRWSWQGAYLCAAMPDPARFEGQAQVELPLRGVGQRVPRRASPATAGHFSWLAGAAKVPGWSVAGDAARQAARTGWPRTPMT